MKQNLLLGILLLSCSIAFAQNKTERYCEIELYPSNKHSPVHIDFGNPDSYTVEDSILVKKINEIRDRTNSITSLLNCMGANHWKMINVTAIGGAQYIKSFYFKKEDIVKGDVELEK